MSAVTREHLAGLELARNDLSGISALDSQILDDMITRARAAPEQEAKPFWIDGAPGRIYGSEWFMAETVTGERVSLIALDEDHSYDYSTADRTYFKAERIKRWAQFPDSDYIPFHPSAEIEQLRAELELSHESHKQTLQKLAEIQALLRDISTRPDNPKIVKNWIDAFLSATAQPAEDQNDE